MKKYYLSTTDQLIGGVCGGLAEYFDLDSTLVRVIMFILILCGSIGLWIYLITWLVAPKRPAGSSPGTHSEKYKGGSHYQRSER